MYGNTNPISRLNAIVDNDNNNNEGKKDDDEELRLFTSTTFFDLDMGRSTDIATTVDELLMQQEKQLQYPNKQQPLDSEANNAPIAGPSRSNRLELQQQIDFANLQKYSIAEELPQANLNLYDVDPMFRQDAEAAAAGPSHGNHLDAAKRANIHTQPTQLQSAPLHNQAGVSHPVAGHSGSHVNSPNLAQNQVDTRYSVQQIPVISGGYQSGVNSVMQNDMVRHMSQLRATGTGHSTIQRHNLIQRHELADHYAPAETHYAQVQPTQPVPQPVSQPSLHEYSVKCVKQSLTDDDKRKRNTAASARFRVKKKEREREMERNHKIMVKKIEDMEIKIRQLETENEWLKKLTLERTEARNVDTLESLRQNLKDGTTQST